jgi:tetratricopeptide (TPR) repeat protein
MRLSLSVRVLIAAPWLSLCLSTSASAQAGLPDLEVECGRGVLEACFALRYGRCADANPRIAIPACTRQLLDRNTAWNNRPDSSLIQMDRATRYALRGTAHAKQGELDQAIDDYDRAIREQGDVYWIHALRGSALFEITREEEALDSFNEALSLAPDDALLLNARSRLLSTALDENVRNGPQAIADAQRASELVPGRQAFVAALATAYAENGEFEKAVETQLRAIDLLDPEDETSLGPYMFRLDLYREGRPFRRELCVKEEDAPPPDREASGSALSSYLAFCFLVGT